MIVDLFAGPGGWDQGARIAGCTEPIVGIEWDRDACRTAVPPLLAAAILRPLLSSGSSAVAA